MIHIYVDGSYNSETEYAGWAYVALSKSEKEIIKEDFGRTPSFALSRQIDGELEATKQALLWAVNQDKDIKIFHDYIGISKWYQDQWKAKKPIAQNFVQFVYIFKKENQDINVSFEHIYSHTGIELPASKGAGFSLH